MGPRPDAAGLWGKGTSFKRTVCDGSLLLGKRGSRDPRFAPAQTDQGCKRETRNHRCEMKRVGATLHEHTGRRLALSNRVPVPGRKESGECTPQHRLACQELGPCTRTPHTMHCRGARGGQGGGPLAGGPPRQQSPRRGRRVRPAVLGRVLPAWPARPRRPRATS